MAQGPYAVLKASTSKKGGCKFHYYFSFHVFLCFYHSGDGDDDDDMLKSSITVTQDHFK